MNEDKIIEEFGIEFAIQNISSIISKKIDEYKKSKSKDIEEQLVELLKDKEKIYDNNKEIIKKYLKKNRGK